MASDLKTHVTEILTRLEDGTLDAAPAADELMDAVYDELRRLARGYLRRERSDHTLEPTALVHEAYLRLIDQNAVAWQGRAQFFGLAAQMMRRILIDHARRHRYAKRGGDRVRVPLEEIEPLAGGRPAELLALDEALTALARIDPRRAKIVELRYFGGLQVQEIARMLELSTATVNRQWRAARAWLFMELNPEGDPANPDS